MPRHIQIGKGNKRTFAEQEHQLTIVAERILQGVRLADIATELGLSLSMIKKDSVKIRKRWQQTQVDRFDEHANRELDKLDLIEREAWQSWEASKAATENKPEGVGDPRFLTSIMTAMERRAKLMGLEQPTQQNINVYNAENIGFAVVNSPELLEHEKQFWAKQAALQKQSGSSGDSADSGE